MDKKTSFSYKKLIKLLFPLPFLLGVAGYLYAGFPIGDALYGSFCFYFVSVYSKAYNILMEVARWTAPLMTVSWVLISFKAVYEYFLVIMLSRKKNATVVYCDEESHSLATELAASIPRAFVLTIDNITSNDISTTVNEQVLYLSEDRSNLEFYNLHSDELADKKVHIILKDIDPVHLKGSNVHYFSMRRQTAVDLWTKYPVATDMSDDHTYKVGIIGKGSLSETILKQGLTQNVFFKDQKIEYHTFGDWKLLRKAYSEMDLMNGDSIYFHETPWCESINILRELDRIIIADKDNIRTIEFLMNYCPNARIFYYSESNENPARFYSSQNVLDFGTTESLITRDNVLGGISDQKAKELYYLMGHEDIDVTQEQSNIDAEWNTLSGAVKHEHIERANYYELYTRLLAEGCKLARSPFAIAPLEHIRWCRTRFTSFWRYGVPENGEFGDPVLKIHKSLVPYDELSDDIQDVELQQIIFMMHHLK